MKSPQQRSMEALYGYGSGAKKEIVPINVKPVEKPKSFTEMQPVRPEKMTAQADDILNFNLKCRNEELPKIKALLAQHDAEKIEDGYEEKTKLFNKFKEERKNLLDKIEAVLKKNDGAGFVQEDMKFAKNELFKTMQEVDNLGSDLVLMSELVAKGRADNEDESDLMEAEIIDEDIAA